MNLLVRSSCLQPDLQLQNPSGCLPSLLPYSHTAACVVAGLSELRCGGTHECVRSLT